MQIGTFVRIGEVLDTVLLVVFTLVVVGLAYTYLVEAGL